jgi:hypothetical protein
LAEVPLAEITKVQIPWALKINLRERREPMPEAIKS